jgi:hypothetical protein
MYPGCPPRRFLTHSPWSRRLRPPPARRLRPDLPLRPPPTRRRRPGLPQRPQRNQRLLPRRRNHQAPRRRSLLAPRRRLHPHPRLVRPPRPLRRRRRLVPPRCSRPPRPPGLPHRRLRQHLLPPPKQRPRRRPSRRLLPSHLGHHCLRPRRGRRRTPTGTEAIPMTQPPRRQVRSHRASCGSTTESGGAAYIAEKPGNFGSTGSIGQRKHGATPVS